MKKLTKKQKALFPEFIALFDVCVDCREDLKKEKGYFYPGYIAKALKAKAIPEAIAAMEKMINEKYGSNIYLMDVLGKTGKEDQQGYPLYEIILRSRIHVSDWQKDDNGKRKVLPANWHLCDQQHNEDNSVIFRWYPMITYIDPLGNIPEDNGDLEFINKNQI